MGNIYNPEFYRLERRKNTIRKIEFIEKKSLFIGFSTFVENEEQALEIIKQKKKSEHIVYHEVVRIFSIGDPDGNRSPRAYRSLVVAALTAI